MVWYFMFKSFKNGGLILDPHLSIFGVPKNAKKSIRALFLGVSEGVLKMDPHPGLQKVRFCCYLLHFSKVGGLKKEQILGTILGTIWETKSLK